MLLHVLEGLFPTLGQFMSCKDKAQHALLCLLLLTGVLGREPSCSIIWAATTLPSMLLAAEVFVLCRSLCASLLG